MMRARAALQFDTLASEHKAALELATSSRTQYEARLRDQAATIGELQAVIAANEHAVRSQKALVRRCSMRQGPSFLPAALALETMSSLGPLCVRA
jgi:hypothetical protein